MNIILKIFVSFSLVIRSTVWSILQAGKWTNYRKCQVRKVKVENYFCFTLQLICFNFCWTFSDEKLSLSFALLFGPTFVSHLKKYLTPSLYTLTQTKNTFKWISTILIAEIWRLSKKKTKQNKYQWNVWNLILWSDIFW